MVLRTLRNTGVVLILGGLKKPRLDRGRGLKISRRTRCFCAQCRQARMAGSGGRSSRLGAMSGVGPIHTTGTGGDCPVHYSYDARDRLRSMGDMRFAYDAGGRLVEKVERGLSTRYAYDASGFLSHVLFPGGQSLTYDRGAGGLLRGTMLDGQPQEEFVWRDGLRLAGWLAPCGVARCSGKTQPRISLRGRP